MSGTSLIGAAILSAIPAVALALWTSYLEADLEELDSDPARRSAFDPVAESRRVRFAGLMALIAQVITFFASRSLVPDGVVGSAVFFMLGILVQSQIQVRAEIRLARHARKLDPSALRPSATPSTAVPEPGTLRSQANAQVRSFWALFAAIMGFVTVIHAAGAAAVLIARWAGASEQAAGAAASVGLLAGILSAVTLFFAISPVLLRNILPSSPIGEGPVLALVHDCFARAGTREPDVRVLDLDHFGANDTLIVGLSRGPRWSRPCLFLAKGALAFPEEELRALVSREAGQVVIGNLGRRFRQATALVLACIPILLAYFGLLLVAFPPEAARLGVFAAPLIPLFFFLHFGRKMTRNLEERADDHALTRLGIPAEALEGALRRIERARRESPETAGEGQEDEALAARISRIRAIGAKAAQDSVAPKDEQSKAA